MILKLIRLTFLFWIILDSLGNVPIFLALLKHVEVKRQRVVIIRELLIALFVMVLFLFFGNVFFKLLHVDQFSLEITGGIVLFLIALPMIFSHPSDNNTLPTTRHEPLIVPLAIPALAGPAILATITVYGGGDEQKWLVLLAIFFAWLFTVPVLLLAPFLRKVMGANGLIAVENFFGYILILISVQMVLHGLMGSFG